jgi:hypothetical protein
MLPTVANMERHTELRIRINRCPRPNVAPSELLLLCGDVLLFRSHEAPDFVALETAHRHTAHSAVMEVSANAANLTQETGDCVLRYPSDPNRAADAVSFAKAPNDLCALGCAKLFHTDYYA